MKKIVFIITICLNLNGISQPISREIGELDSNYKNEFGNGNWEKPFEHKVDVNGTPYLFDSWLNTGKIYLSDRVLNVMSFNYNMQLERFEANISEDSVFVVNPQGINKIIIRDNEFIRTLDPEYQRNSYFQKIVAINGKLLLEKHTVEVKEGQINPMTMQKTQKDALIKKEVFYIANEKGKELKKIKLKKSIILSLIEKSKVNRIKEYAKQNKLKFKDVKDVHNILKFSKTI